MSIDKPYYRCCRPFVDNTYSGSMGDSYIRHPAYAKDPSQSIRAYQLIQKDLINLFEYIEPADENLACYSHRIHELLIRTCIEFEANCKAILNAHDTKLEKGQRMTIIDYSKLETTHRLSSYKIQMPVWSGINNTYTPFHNWKANQSLTWYQAYNASKHNRFEEFHNSNFKNLLNAIAGLNIILSSQFYRDDFSYTCYIVTEGINDGMDGAIGDYFRIKFPDDWPDAEKYNFTKTDWENLCKESDNPFQMFNYKKIKSNQN